MTTSCSNCKRPVSGGCNHHWLFPDGWGWLNSGALVCPTCVSLGVPVDDIAGPGN